MSASAQSLDSLSARFETLSLARLDDVLAVEQEAYSHPWTRGNFTDAMASGYQIQLLMGDEQILGVCRTWGVESENQRFHQNRPQRDQFLPDLQPNSRAIGQKDGVLEERRSQKWAAAADLQPTIRKSDRLLGYFVAMLGVDEAHLLNLTVAPAFQRQGWAQVLLDALALWARGQGAQWLWLEVRASNLRARQIYEAHGFRRVGDRKRYYPASATEREDAVVMSRPL